MRRLFVLASALLGVPFVGSACESATETEARDPVRVDVERYFVPVSADDHVRGAQLPLVTIVVYSNYACQPCTALWRTLGEVVAAHPDDVRVVARHVDVRGYEKGGLAAEAVIAAATQGKYWEMHEALVTTPRDLSKPMIFHLAETIGLDVARFESELRSARPQRLRVTASSQARELGLNAAPVVLVNGIPYAGPPADIDAWTGLLETEFEHARGLIATGITRAALYDEIMRNALREPLPAARTQKTASPPVAAGTSSGSSGDDADAPRASRDRDLSVITRPDPKRRYRIPLEGLPSYGPDDAPVVIVEIVDFDCPYCAEAQTTLISLRDRYPDDVRIVVLNNPLSLHTRARLAARASLAAQRQGRYWSYHDALFTPQRGTDRSAMLGLAERLGLDRARFEKDLDDAALGNRIDRERNLAIDLGAVTTPSFVVNGRYVEGVQSQAHWDRLIEHELGRAKELEEAGASRASLAEKLLAGAVDPAAFPNRTGPTLPPSSNP